MFFKPSDSKITEKREMYYKLDAKIFSCENDVEKDDPNYSYWQRKAEDMKRDQDKIKSWFHKYGIDY
jgi:hypothetical protein